MNKPKITDRTKLYVGLFKHCGSDTFTLGITFDNSTQTFKSPIQWPRLRDAETIFYEDSVFAPSDCPLTLVKLADLIRKTKVSGYTHFVVTDCTFVWTQRTSEGLYSMDNRFFPIGGTEYYADWRDALRVLKKRLTAKLQGIRKAGKELRLKYTEIVKAQAAIGATQAAIIRTNNRYFKGIPY